MISAVNGDLWLDNIGCFRYRVKLNNPLMGTETQFAKDGKEYEDSARLN